VGGERGFESWRGWIWGEKWDFGEREVRLRAIEDGFWCTMHANGLILRFPNEPKHLFLCL